MFHTPRSIVAAFVSLVVAVAVSLTIETPRAGAAPATNLRVGTCSSVTAGNECSISVGARDGSSATDTGYRGTVRFTSTDPAATLPADYTFTAGDAGEKAFTVVFRTPGAQRVTVTDTANGSLTGQSREVTVHADAASTLRVGACSSVTAGSPCSLHVDVRNARGDRVTSYRGTVRFTSTDPAVTLPAHYTFTAGDAGEKAFTVVFRTPGAQRVTVTDTANGSLTGQSREVTVHADAASTLRVGACSSVTAGSPCSVHVDVRNARGDRVTSYRGTVRFTSTDPAVTLPADYTFTAGDAGEKAFTVVFRTPGAQRVTVTDTANGALTGTSGATNVSVATTTTTTVVQPTTTTTVAQPTTTVPSGPIVQPTTTTVAQATTTVPSGPIVQPTTTTTVVQPTTTTTVAQPPADGCASPTGWLSGPIERLANQIGPAFGLRSFLHDLAVRICRLGF